MVVRGQMIPVARRPSGTDILTNQIPVVSQVRVTEPFGGLNLVLQIGWGCIKHPYLQLPIGVLSKSLFFLSLSPGEEKLPIPAINA